MTDQTAVNTIQLSPRPKKVKPVINDRVRQFRNELWPDAEKRIWSHEKRDGWLIIPRAMPLILRILDSMSKRQPVSATYLDLFCRTFNNGFVNAKLAREMSFYSGFTGERAMRTWTDRIDKLCELGLISVKEGPSGRISYILIEDPFSAIQKLYEAGKVEDQYWYALRDKMMETGAAESDELSNNTRIEANEEKT